MPMIESFQEREPQSNSTLKSRTYTEFASADSFVVRAVKVLDADINHITIFFPKKSDRHQGVGLRLDAPEAVSLAHAILAVAQVVPGR